MDGTAKEALKLEVGVAEARARGGNDKGKGAFMVFSWSCNVRHNSD